MSKRNYNHTSDNEETLTEDEMKNIIPDIEPKKLVSTGYTWMLKPDGKGGYFKIRFVKEIYDRHIKEGWKAE